MAQSSNTFLVIGAVLSLAFSVAASGVLGYDFTKIRVDARDVPHLYSKYPHIVRRANTVQADITNELLLYFINITVGTPPQPLSLQLDTGSSDIWFPSAQSDICQENAQACTFGSYDLTASSTGTELQKDAFQIEYVDGSMIEGDYISDVLNLGNTQVKNVTMAAATTASRAIGIMGIGYQAGESIAETEGLTYPSFVSELVEQGQISSLAYSLWLNDVKANTGSILFGGIDTSKYVGSLVALPIQTDASTGSLTSFTVAWTGLTSSSGGSTQTYTETGTAIAAILDSGTTDTLLPDAVANSIYSALGVTTDPSYGNLVSCDMADDDLTFTFTFGGPHGASVKVPLSEFVTPLLTTDGSTPTVDGKSACTFAIDSAGSDPILFGDSFLRSAYVVYDLQNNMIGLAQTDFNGVSSNIKEISANGIPDVSTTASAVTVQQTFSGHPLQTGAAGTAAGTSAITRSATISLSSAASTSGSSSAMASSGAASPLTIRAAEPITIWLGLVAIASFLYGGVMFVM
jgi:hypothetical protein